MKKVLPFLLAGILLWSGTAFATGQDYRVSLHTGGDIPLSQALSLAEAQSPYLFNYSDKDVAGLTVRADLSDTPLDRVLTLLLEGTRLTWVVKEKNIVISRQKDATPDSQESRPVELTGSVADESGQPIPGVAVLDSVSGKGEITDSDGRFRISTREGCLLRFEYIGYQSINYRVGKAAQVSITMPEDHLVLDESVVTALGIKKSEKSLGYSIQQVNSEAFSKVKTDNPLNMLNGKVAGLTLRTRAGILEDPVIRLRGEAPIYVVNGTPVAYYRAVSNDDIESITVLKGAQAAVLYGARGANGAILITTKTGENMRKGTDVTFNSSTMFTAGYLTMAEQQTIYGTGEYGQYAYGDGKGGGLRDDLWSWGPKLDQPDPTTESGYVEIVQYNSPIDPDTGERVPLPFVSHKNNFQKFLQEGLVTDNNISVTKKFDGGSFRVSLNQMYRRGETPNTSLKKFGVTTAANYDITSRLHLAANMIYSYTYSANRPWSGYSNEHPYYNILVYMGANMDIMDLKDYWEKGYEGYAQRNWNHVWFNNPWFVAEELTRPYSEPELIASASLRYDILPGLDFLVKASTDSKHQNTELCQPYAWVDNKHGQYSVSSTRNVDVNMDAMLSYKQRWGIFSVDAMAGASFYELQYNYLHGETSGGLAQPGLYNLSNSVLTQKTTSTIERRRMVGVYATATFSLLDAFYLTFTGRNDWSSTLNPDNNSFFYPSASFSALLNEVLPLPKAISFWKARISWARVGFDQSTPYRLNNVYTQNTTYPYWGSNMVMTPATSIIDPNIKPYFTNSFEVGTDIRFLDNRLRLDYSFYRTLDEGQIQYVDVNQSSGYESMLTNGNDYRRIGHEVLVGVVPIRSHDWDLGLNFNWSRSRKYLDKIYNDVLTYDHLVVGDRADAIYAKVWQRDPDGNFIVQQNGRPIEDPFYRLVGYSNPDWEFGVSMNLRYRRWKMAANVAGRFGGLQYSDLNSRMVDAGTHPMTAVPERELDWSQVASYIPDDCMVVTGGEITYDDFGNILSDTRTFAPSTIPVFYKNHIRYIAGLTSERPTTVGYNAWAQDFVKLRTVSLTYDFSDLVKRSRYIKGLELSLIGNNLLIWKKLPFEDPDAAYKNFSYPTERLVGFNLSLTL